MTGIENTSKDQSLHRVFLEIKIQIEKAGLLPDEEKSDICSMWIQIPVGEYKICHYPTSAVYPWGVVLGDTSVSFETLDECISFVRRVAELKALLQTHLAAPAEEGEAESSTVG